MLIVFSPIFVADREIIFRFDFVAPLTLPSVTLNLGMFKKNQ